MNRATVRGRFVKDAAFRLNSAANRARILARDLADARERRREIAAGPSIAERQAELLAFYERFERFVETLCNAAQYGPTDRLDAAYADDRAWIVERYAVLAPYASAYLAPEEADAFDRLFGAPDLSTFLSLDDGSAIFLITHTREALSLYAEHLRQLVARKAA